MCMYIVCVSIKQNKKNQLFMNLIYVERHRTLLLLLLLFYFMYRY